MMTECLYLRYAVSSLQVLPIPDTYIHLVLPLDGVIDRLLRNVVP
jgi:hypothetical protein